MMGRNHIVAGIGLAAVGAAGLKAGEGLTDAKVASLAGLPPRLVERAERGLGLVGDLCVWAQDWLVPVEGGAGLAFYFAAAAALFVLGTLLPDIDSSSSILGRRLRVPLGPHRGITHTDWFLVLLLLAALPEPTRVLAFLWLGAVTHCALDGWSTAGRARFWPLGRYRSVSLPDGGLCIVRQSPRALHYRTGGAGEYVLAWAIAAGGFAAVLLAC